MYVALTRVKQSADGSSSALLVYTLDPRFNSMAEGVQDIHTHQPGAYQARSHPQKRQG